MKTRVPTKAAEDCRTPKAGAVSSVPGISARFWSAAVLCRFDFCGSAALLIAIFQLPLALNSAQFKCKDTPLPTPDGFEIELIGESPLVDRPIPGSFDEQGRLYLPDSSGSNDKPAE